MNEAGESNIVFGDGLDNKENSFALLDAIGSSGSEIEVLFVERIGQLLASGGIAAVILPSSILSNSSESYTGARKELLGKFMLRAIVKLGSKTFGATGTNTVIMFLERYAYPPESSSLVKDSRDAILEGRDLTDWEDEEIQRRYLELQGLSVEEWGMLVNRSCELDDLPEYFCAYREVFDARKENHGLKPEEYCRKFWEYVRKVKGEKLFYYGMTYRQRTVVIIAPSDNASQKEFLGYDWSSKKGREGIQYVEPRGGKMYVNVDREAEGTLADVVRQSFSDGDVEMRGDAGRYSRVVRTSGMLDFSRVSFNASIELQEQRKTKLTSKYPTVKLEDIALVIVGQSPESQYYNKDREGTQFYQGKKEFGFMLLGKPTTWTTKVTKSSRRDDILMNIRAPVGNVNLNQFEEICIGRGLAAIRAKEKMNELYLYYLLYAVKGSISGHDGAVLDSISKGELKHIRLPFPPLDVQQQVISECEAITNEYNTSRMTIEDYKVKILAIFNRLGVILSN